MNLSFRERDFINFFAFFYNFFLLFLIHHQAKYQVCVVCDLKCVYSDCLFVQMYSYNPVGFYMDKYMVFLRCGFLSDQKNYEIF